MNELNDRGFYEARVRSARHLARCAKSPAIAAIHADMVERYENILAEIDREEHSTAARSSSEESRQPLCLVPAATSTP